MGWGWGDESLSPTSHKELLTTTGVSLEEDPLAFRELQPQATASLQPQKTLGQNHLSINHAQIPDLQKL